VTAPDTGGRAFTLAPGGRPVMLTQYAAGADSPLLLINLDVAAGRAYIGADSTVSPNNGVPLDPGTAMPWTTAGQVWAVADPDATGPLTLVVTAAISDWTPSPAAIAAEVAAELLLNGIPNVLTETIIAQNDIILVSSTKTYDISGAASLGVVINRLGGAITQLRGDQLDSGGDVVDTEMIPVQVSGGGKSWMRWAATGSQLQITNPDPTWQMAVWIIGSNRPPLQRLDVRRDVSNGDMWSIANTNMVAGNIYPLAQDDADVKLLGKAFAVFSLADTAHGRFELVILGGATVVLCDTAEMFVSSSGSRFLMRDIALPATDYSVQFRCFAVGGIAAPAARFIPADR
jgi:hypothetical protein